MYINNGNASLTIQIKQRLRAIIVIKRYCGENFSRKAVFGLVLGKAKYNITVWGGTNQSNKRRINHLIAKAARNVTGKSAIGRTDTWALKEADIAGLEEIYHKAIAKVTFYVINNNKDHNHKYILLSNVMKAN